MRFETGEIFDFVAAFDELIDWLTKSLLKIASSAWQRFERKSISDFKVWISLSGMLPDLPSDWIKFW